MKVIINTTNLKVGGALQVAISLIRNCIYLKEHEFHIFLSPSIDKEINREQFSANFIFYSFNNPSRLIIFDKTIRLLNEIEQLIQPDCVFSVFGPTYWKPKSKHIMGFANGLYLYNDSPYFQMMKLSDRLQFELKKIYHRLLLKNNADFYILQTEDMKKRFAKFIDKPENIMSVVSSKYDSIFEKEIVDLDLVPYKSEDEFWFVTISSFYPHKRLDLINDLVPIIKKERLKIKFVLTLPDEIIDIYFSDVKEYIINIGPIKLEECPYVYSKCDALFLPTLIESFTASYPEAMIMKKPILTSNYAFATTVCKNAALYFNPYDIGDIMIQIKKIYSDKNIYEQLILNGLKVVAELPSSKERAEKYLKLCAKVIENVQK